MSRRKSTQRCRPMADRPPKAAPNLVWEQALNAACFKLQVDRVDVGVRSFYPRRCMQTLLLAGGSVVVLCVRRFYRRGVWRVSAATSDCQPPPALTQRRLEAMGWFHPVPPPVRRLGGFELTCHQEELPALAELSVRLAVGLPWQGCPGLELFQRPTERRSDLNYRWTSRAWSIEEARRGSA